MNLTLKSDISLCLTSPLLSSALQIYLLLPLPKSDSRDRRDGAPSRSFTAFPTRQAGAVTRSADASTAALTLTSHGDVCGLPDPEAPRSSPTGPGLPLNLPPSPFPRLADAHRVRSPGRARGAPGVLPRSPRQEPLHVIGPRRYLLPGVRRRDADSFRKAERRKQGSEETRLRRCSSTAGVAAAPRGQMRRRMRARPLAAPVAALASDRAAEDYLPGQSPPLGGKRCVSLFTTLFGTFPEFLSRGQNFGVYTKSTPQVLFLRPFLLASQTGSVLYQTSPAGTSGTGEQGSGKVLGGEGKAAAAAAAAGE